MHTVYLCMMRQWVTSVLLFICGAIIGEVLVALNYVPYFFSIS
jgi:hypothetical protein